MRIKKITAAAVALLVLSGCVGAIPEPPEHPAGVNSGTQTSYPEVNVNQLAVLSSDWETLRYTHEFSLREYQFAAASEDSSRLLLYTESGAIRTWYLLNGETGRIDPFLAGSEPDQGTEFRFWGNDFLYSITPEGLVLYPVAGQEPPVPAIDQYGDPYLLCGGASDPVSGQLLLIYALPEGTTPPEGALPAEPLSSKSEEDLLQVAEVPSGAETPREEPLAGGYLLILLERTGAVAAEFHLAELLPIYNEERLPLRGISCEIRNNTIVLECAMEEERGIAVLDGKTGALKRFIPTHQQEVGFPLAVAGNRIAYILPGQEGLFCIAETSGDREPMIVSESSFEALELFLPRISLIGGGEELTVILSACSKTLAEENLSSEVSSTPESGGTETSSHHSALAGPVYSNRFSACVQFRGGNGEGTLRWSSVDRSLFAAGFTPSGETVLLPVYPKASVRQID